MDQKPRKPRKVLSESELQENALKVEALKQKVLSGLDLGTKMRGYLNELFDRFTPKGFEHVNDSLLVKVDLIEKIAIEHMRAVKILEARINEKSEYANNLMKVVDGFGAVVEHIANNK